MTNVWLIGGPGDGDVIQVTTSAGWIDVGASRYVLRETYPLEGDEPNGSVGMFLPLYASLLMARPAFLTPNANSQPGGTRSES